MNKFHNKKARKLILKINLIDSRSILEGLNPPFFMSKWADKSWQKDFLNMKSHSTADAKLLMGGVKGLKDAWCLGALHVEYERLKKIQEEKQQQ